MMKIQPEKLIKTLSVKNRQFQYYSLSALEKMGWEAIHHLPYAIKILLESALRNYGNNRITANDILNILQWAPRQKASCTVAFNPGRVILQDFTGVPCVVDLAAMRSALNRLGKDHRMVNPSVRCDLVIDHSLQVDFSACDDAVQKNLQLEFKRNKERYAFLKWGQKAFGNFRVIPPGKGIIHQINLEYLSSGIIVGEENGQPVVFPDSLIGTDSHTTTINALGVLGWGVGGIEAEAVMLGEPIYVILPEVIGVRLIGQLQEGVTATDAVLAITQALRQKGVVGKFIEFFGPALKNLTLPDRATIANMAPEYGATVGLFPVDNETISYLRRTGRKEEDIVLFETYMREQGMFYEGTEPVFTEVMDFHLDKVEPSVAGPRRPQDRISLKDVKRNFESIFGPLQEWHTDTTGKKEENSDVKEKNLSNGAIVIASITSCTNTSNPALMVAAGLLAKKAVDRGLNVPWYVKTSFAPGSRVVTEYLTEAGLAKYLDKLGFQTVGFGCATCIGNSGPLDEKVAKHIQKDDLVVASVLSGNRNFEGRIHPLTKANYLASPPLVVAYAIAGRIDVEFLTEPLGKDKEGREVYLKDVWPTEKEIRETIQQNVKAAHFVKKYKDIFEGDNLWNAINVEDSGLYPWDPQSTYIQEPPFFESITTKTDRLTDICGARALAVLGDSITTDHISPAGMIPPDSPAGRYLTEKGVPPQEFNSYGSRRGNDRVMTRGTFANIRLRNQLTSSKEGGWTIYFPEEKEMDIYTAASLYKQQQIPLIILAGKEYGTGSSRDWAAKGTALLGVKIVLAESFERIHRSNLVGMGVLPLQFEEGQSWKALGLTGREVFETKGLDTNLKPNQKIQIIAVPESGTPKEFPAIVRLDSPVEIEYYRQGGILQMVLRKMAGIS